MKFNIHILLQIETGHCALNLNVSSKSFKIKTGKQKEMHKMYILFVCLQSNDLGFTYNTVKTSNLLLITLLIKVVVKFIMQT